MAKIINRIAWTSPHLTGWRLTIEAASIKEAETEAATIGTVADIMAVGTEFLALVVNEPVSPLMALHQRWEQTQAEYSAIEDAERALPKGDTERFALERAMKASCREANAVANATLFQVPMTWAEAMVLQYHALNAYDLLSSNEGGKELEWDTVETALEAVFDFMACELPDDHGTIGTAFQEGANRVFQRRRLRTGVVED
ncbi:MULTISPECIES: hypothetical protein [unclassified Sphingomonas]|uniref:hypothetical protein n=1 Tax=unclassified Sphingomonas TaxID=196159 RepID=UPI0021519121|nr:MULTISPECIES: hypothetical protein [unclassified Sphingomonas]MCR5872279.1 hypothetical protein [Sphingomonas sp. J344]UUX99421.1 hypothetical protein LRS08_18580 [Sphingomonas sp. J315]